MSWLHSAERGFLPHGPAVAFTPLYHFARHTTFTYSLTNYINAFFIRLRQRHLGREHQDISRGFATSTLGTLLSGSNRIGEARQASAISAPPGVGGGKPWRGLSLSPVMSKTSDPSDESFTAQFRKMLLTLEKWRSRLHEQVYSRLAVIAARVFAYFCMNAPFLDATSWVQEKDLRNKIFGYEALNNTERQRLWKARGCHFR